MDGWRGEQRCTIHILEASFERRGYCHHIRSDCRNKNRPLIFDPEMPTQPSHTQHLIPNLPYICREYKKK